MKVGRDLGGMSIFLAPARQPARGQNLHLEILFQTENALITYATGYQWRKQTGIELAT